MGPGGMAARERKGTYHALEFGGRCGVGLRGSFFAGLLHRLARGRKRGALVVASLWEGTPAPPLLAHAPQSERHTPLPLPPQDIRSLPRFGSGCRAYEVALPVRYVVLPRKP